MQLTLTGPSYRVKRTTQLFTTLKDIEFSHFKIKAGTVGVVNYDSRVLFRQEDVEGIGSDIPVFDGDWFFSEFALAVRFDQTVAAIEQ